MQKLIPLLFVMTLTACSEFPWVYKIDIEQGNIIEQEQVDQLVPGLTKSQVQFILGSPIIIDTFNQDRWDYIYSISRGGGERRQERLSLLFQDNRLESFNGDFIPSSAVTGEQTSVREEVEPAAEVSAEDIMESVDTANQEAMGEPEDGMIQISVQDDEGNTQRVK